jgi:hypothetical protein
VFSYANSNTRLWLLAIVQQPVGQLKREGKLLQGTISTKRQSWRKIQPTYLPMVKGVEPALVAGFFICARRLWQPLQIFAFKVSLFVAVVHVKRCDQW